MKDWCKLRQHDIIDRWQNIDTIDGLRQIDGFRNQSW